MNITKLTDHEIFSFSWDEASFNQTQFGKHYSRTCFVASEFQKAHVQEKFKKKSCQ